MVKSRDQRISLAIEFDEVANGKGTRTDEIFLSHNKFALARLRNGSRNIFVCFVLGEACIPAILLFLSRGLVPFSCSNPVAYFLLLYLQRSANPCHPFISILRDDLRRDNNDPCLPREVLSWKQPSLFFRALLNLARSQMLGAQEQKKRSSSEAAAKEAIGFDSRL